MTGSDDGAPEQARETPGETLISTGPPPIEERASKYDRWAHRRGEPRVFAFLWTVYLVAATALALATVGAGGRIPVEVYRPVAQVLLVTVGAGIVVVWPLVRLSQGRPSGSAAWAALVDYSVVILPVQAVIWPQAWLTVWPLDVVGAIALNQACWGALVAGILAWVQGRPEAGGVRLASAGIWMGVILMLVLGAPVVGRLAAGSALPLWAGVGSPLTAVHTLTSGLPVGSLGPSVPAEAWTMMVLPGAAGAALWLSVLAGEAWRGFRGAR